MTADDSSSLFLGYGRGVVGEDPNAVSEAGSDDQTPRLGVFIAGDTGRQDHEGYTQKQQ